ncbi:MAG: hypothetical protein ACHQKY_14870 [Terriglobia bacterium]
MLSYEKAHREGEFYDSQAATWPPYRISRQIDLGLKNLHKGTAPMAYQLERRLAQELKSGR